MTILPYAKYLPLNLQALQAAVHLLRRLVVLRCSHLALLGANRARNLADNLRDSHRLYRRLNRPDVHQLNRR